MMTRPRQPPSNADPEFRAWVDRAKNGRFDLAVQICGFIPAKGMDKKMDQAGPCPACGGNDRFSVNFSKRKFNCRHCGARGANALALALVGARVSFIEACEALSGEAKPAKVQGETDEQKAARLAKRAKMDADAAKDAQKRVADEARYRAAEQEAARRIWNAAHPPSPARLGTYWAARGLKIPASALIREVEFMPYHHGFERDERGYNRPRVIHQGPAMVAALLDNDGLVVGVHITYLRADWAGKLEIFDPETGEKLPSKKMRGSKKGSHIVVREPDAQGVRLFIAEGIETCASVAVAMAHTKTLWAGDVFWAAGDLGNIGGKSLGTVPHPTLKTPRGKPQSVPNAVPDMAAPAIQIPPYIREVVLLGDGDSDAFLTRNTLVRGKRRFLDARFKLQERDGTIPDLVVKVVVAPQGHDFNDVLRGVAA